MLPAPTVRSVNGIPIRLTDERWLHITDEHAELAELRSDVLAAIPNPERIVAGSAAELLAIRMIEAGKALVVVYREDGEDGFVTTAFVTRRLSSLARRRQVWPA